MTVAGVSVLILIVVCNISQYECEIICFSCTGLSDGEQCHNAVFCAENEVCFTQKYRTKDNITKYDVGCSYPELCRKDSTGVIFGKRMIDHGHVICHQCCQDNVCNSILTCNDNYKVPSLSCLSCSGIIGTDQCNNTIECSKNEVCFTQKYRTSLNQEYYDLGCKSSTICMNGFYSYTFGRRSDSERHLLCESCCGGNSHCNRELVCSHHNQTSVNGSCTSTSGCQSNLICLSGKCQCPTYDYYWSSNKCTLLKGNNQVCATTDECRKPLQCLENFCKCQTDQYLDGIKCSLRKMHNDTCKISPECSETLFCNHGVCKCDRTDYWTGNNCTATKECHDIQSLQNGVYTIYPTDRFHSKPVYCVFQNGTKWTVIQRRVNGSVDFNISWTNYTNGFGNVHGEYWLGNKYIHSISTNGPHKIRFQLGKNDGTIRYADYSTFRIGDEKRKYVLTLSGYSGTAGDSLVSVEINGVAAGHSFTTFDHDNDNNVGNCAKQYYGGWWYNNCEYAALNRRYSDLEWDYSMGHLTNTMMMIARAA